MGSKIISVGSLRAFKEYCSAASAKPAVVDFTGEQLLPCVQRSQRHGSLRADHYTGLSNYFAYGFPCKRCLAFPCCHLEYKKEMLLQLHGVVPAK